MQYFSLLWLGYAVFLDHKPACEFFAIMCRATVLRYMQSTGRLFAKRSMDRAAELLETPRVVVVVGGQSAPAKGTRIDSCPGGKAKRGEMRDFVGQWHYVCVFSVSAQLCPMNAIEIDAKPVN